ncbi:MAG: hypothetical protein PWR02_648 [Synergistales bacterium]|nr:hypothetical protein [Synergistales bacterium]MDN5335622.1 hypothetical protein [Synergistales bacterium]
MWKKSSLGSREKKALKVSWVGLWVNAVLTAFKFVAGILGHSAAMTADAVHSLSDFATDIVAVVTFRITGRPVDSSHDYGHGKFETLSSVVIGVSLVVVALGILYSGGGRILRALHGEVITPPGMIALFAAVVSVVSKEWLYRYTAKEAKALKSDALKAKAWDHRSDALSSIGTLLGIGGAIFLGERARVLDPIAAIAVSVLILRIALPITWQALGELVETSLPEEAERKLLDVIKAVDGVEDAHHLRTRRIGTAVAVDVHVIVDPSLTVAHGHDIATEVERAARSLHGKNSFVSVHVEPRTDESGNPPRGYDDGHNGFEEGPPHHDGRDSESDPD